MKYKQIVSLSDLSQNKLTHTKTKFYTLTFSKYILYLPENSL